MDHVRRAAGQPRLWNHSELRALVSQANSMEAMRTCVNIVRETITAAIAQRPVRAAAMASSGRAATIG